jgi:cytochrome c-type biogenesis protein CcmH
VRRLAAAAALLVLALPASALAGPCPKTSLGEIEHEVMCPVCGVPLELATEAPQAKRERAYIERLVAQCRSKREIEDLLVAQFGDRVLADPPKKGFDAAAFVVPIAAVLAGAAALALGVARWRRRRPPEPPTGASARPALAGDDAARVEADLESYDL